MMRAYMKTRRNFTALIRISLSLFLSLPVRAEDEAASFLFGELPTVVSATLREQKVTDVPGVVSVITRQQIKEHGYRTVSEVLLSVPGFSNLQNDDEYLVPPRGIYASTNQKVLVMRDGHVYNEPVLDLVKLDYSISLESVDRIEVIRGPGASLYGNAAMAAVVNIITYKGNLKQATLGAGNHRQVDFDTVLATKKDDMEVTMYGRYARTGGEKFTVSAAEDPAASNKQEGKVVAHEFPDNSNVGFTMKKGGLGAAFSHQKHRYGIYWSSSGLNTNTEQLVKQPHFSLESFHADLNYAAKPSDKLALSFNHYADQAHIFIIKNNGQITTASARGSTQSPSWKADKIGLNYMASWDVAPSFNALFGMNFEHRRYGDNFNVTNTSVTTTAVAQFISGDQTRNALYAQADWTPTEFAVVNAGVRYDYADDYDPTTNPRLALILKPAKNISSKIIYTTAFQTPGWSYQNSTVQGSGSLSRLSSEKLTSYQYVLRYDSTGNRFNLEGVYFTNKLDNLIIQNSVTKFYENSGKFKNHGYELEARGVLFGGLSLAASYAYLAPKARDISNAAVKVKDGRFRNLPSSTVNLDCLYRLKAFTFNVNAKKESAFYDKDTILRESKIIANATVTARASEDLDFSASVYNLGDKGYKLGDDGTSALPQPGRWFLVRASHKF
jgi:outer membrane receptor for ferrienterochelin and colicins